MSRKLLVSCIFVFMVCNAAGRSGPAYTVAQTFALSRDANGMNGKMELLLDSRLTPAVRKLMWGTGDWSFVLSPESELFREFSATPPAHARLVVTDNSEKVIADRTLDTALAEMKEWSPASGPNREYLLTVDHSSGAGSYNGLATTVIRVSQSSLHDVESVDVASQKQELIRLSKTLKSDWRIDSSSGVTNILFVSCHPGKADGFVIDYVRYEWNGSAWLKYVRKAPGVWESDGPFPARSAFL
ncbi:MAG TPA: hypothetical protein VFK06_08160 [Candidatus Angelobacter sp.]|nr:hypothetical protein [Candidatus Angelobacter sp.]